MTIAIVDSGFVYALFDTDDKHHEKALSIIGDTQWEFYTPPVIFVEIFKLMADREKSGHRSRASLVRDFARGLTIVSEQPGFYFEELTPADTYRVIQILNQYADSGVDYVDAVVVALAERFRTPYVMTTDQDDFRRYVPNFTQHFILPLFDL